MFLVQHIAEHYAHCLSILLLFGVFYCNSQRDPSRKHVYKYFMEKMPQDFNCESVLKLADVEHELIHCVINGIRQTVVVVDPKDIDIEWSPRAETYSSRVGGIIRFFLKLKEEEHPFTWLKIRPAEEFGKKSPQIQNASITWEAGVGGCFRYYVVSPFKAIAFTLKRVNKLFYDPLFDSAYLKGVSKFPLKLNTLTDPRACTVASKTLISSANPLLNGVPGRYNVTCGNGDFSQSVFILRSRIFEIFYGEMTIPFTVKIRDPTLTLSDIERYACFWVTLTEMGQVFFNKRIDSSKNNVTIHCAAFVGPIAVRATLHHLLHSQANFRLFTAKLSYMYLAIASYSRKPGVVWIGADPVHLAPQICSVHCTSIHEGGPQFIGAIGVDRITRAFEAFDCYCQRTYKLMTIRRRAKFSFLLKRSLLLLNWETSHEDPCIIDIQNEIDVMPNDFYQKVVPVVRYRQMQSQCPALECEYVTKELGKYSLLYWNRHTTAVEFFTVSVSKLILNIKAIKVQIEGAKRLFLLANRDSEEVIMCHASGAEPLSGEELRVKWSFSQIFYHPAPPLIDGEKIILNDKVGEGAFCAICTIPLLQSSTPTNETCFVVIHAYRFNITLVPKDEDGVYILGSTNILRCSVSIIENLMDLDPHVPTCRLKAHNESVQNTLDSAVRLGPDQRAGPITLDIIISLFEIDVIIKPTTVWFVDPTLFELQILNVSHIFDIRWTGTITCALKSEDMNEVFMRHFRWVETHTNAVVPNSYYNQLFIRNQEEMQHNYTCNFKIGNLKKDLNLRYVDFSKIILSTNAKTVYDIYQKGYQIHCYVHPEEAQNYAEFVWGWYDSIKKVYRKFVEVDTFEEGAHHLSCSSPRSSIRPHNITFYVLRSNVTKLMFTPRMEVRYKRSDKLPNCAWTVAWMNKEPGLRPTLSRLGFVRGGIFRGQSKCTFNASDFARSAVHTFRIIEKEDLQLKLSQTFAAVLKETPTVVCHLDPPIYGIEEPYFYPVREFGLVQVRGNRIIPGNSNSNSSSGTYICIFDKQGLYMTKIFVISNVDLSMSPMITPAKREFVSGEEVECSGKMDPHSGYYAIDVSYKNTHIPLVNKQQNRAILSSAFVTDITISCTLRNSYLNIDFGEKNVALSALVRPKKLIKLKPGDQKFVDTSAVVHCAFDSTPKIGQHVTLNLFIFPLGYRLKVEKISLFSFKDQGVIGGRYFFVCAVVNDDGPIWATIDEIVFLQTPAIPKISHKHIYGDQSLYCWTAEYPVFNRLMVASVESENGEIEANDNDFYQFSAQSCYGYYNVTCEAYGYYHLIAFHFSATYQVHYTGPEYDARNAVDISKRDIIRICALLLLVVTILLLIAFFTLEKYFRHQRILRITKDYEVISRNWLSGRILRRRRIIAVSSSEDSLEIIEVEKSAGTKIK
ncbi:hypothetical protein TcWFU_006408 [Taenia crassiceps]|uniref:Ig-like domain-containing protein n=1 Tax=Taenia crassiceps TaxID=6207 RepID=A0ABR4QLS9_9CEST